MKWCVAWVLLTCCLPRAWGQQDLDELINYPYAVGDTAFFNVVGQSVQAVRLPISYTLRRPEEGPFGIKLILPVSVGFYEFSAANPFGEGPLSESVATLSALAGVEFQVPLGRRWELEPFVELGAGKDLEGGKWATIYSAGLRNVGEFQGRRRLFRVGGSLDYDGARLGSDGSTDSFTTLEVGLDVRFPIAGRSHWSDWSLYGMRRRFLDPLTFDQLDGTTTEVRNQNELGVTFGLDPPFELWLLKVERLGVGYRFGERVDSVRILFSVPF